jgi:4-amino-4-deoxy-L-arabinose transferase-like glycosyltransferase
MRQNSAAAFAAILIAVTALRVFALALTPIDLHGDEAQYWLWSRTLDWGYFSKPPLIAWVIALTTGVFGDAEWAVRLSAPLGHAGAAAALFALGRRMGGSDVGFWAGLAWLMMPGVWLSSALISTDALLLPLWALALFAAWRFVETRTLAAAAMLGAALGFGVLAKYAMLYFAVGAAIAVVAIPRVRAAAASAHAWIAPALAMVIVAPNLVWNAGHDFATISHTAANAAWRPQFGDVAEAASFITDQLGVAGPILFPLALWCAWRCWRNAHGDWRAMDDRIRFLLAFAAPPLAIILVQAFISRAHGNWAATAYPAALTLIALHFFGGAAPSPRVRLGAWMAASVHVAFGCVFLAGFLSPQVADALGLGNALTRSRAWEATAALVRSTAQAGSPQGPFTAVLVDNRLVFNDLSYYLRDAQTPPLRMWVLADKPGNQAEQSAPMHPSLGARVLIVGATPDYEPWIAADFRAVGALRRESIALGGDRSRTLSFRIGYQFQPAPRDPAYLARITRRGD